MIKTEELKEIESVICSRINDNSDFNEDDTKHKIINYLLTKLGWEIYENMEFEYPISTTHSANPIHVDYMLNISGEKCMAIEAKRLGKNLSDKFRGDISTYMMESGVEIGVLTNGIKAEVYIKSNSVGSSNYIEPLDEFRFRKCSSDPMLMDLLKRNTFKNSNQREKINEIKKNTTSFQQTELKEDLEGAIKQQINEHIPLSDSNIDLHGAINDIIDSIPYEDINKLNTNQPSILSTTDISVIINNEEVVYVNKEFVRDEFRDKIEKIKQEEGYSQGTIIVKFQLSDDGRKCGPYASLVEPYKKEGQNRDWHHLGKPSKIRHRDETTIGSFV
jgi:hypothetical protein